MFTPTWLPQLRVPQFPSHLLGPREMDLDMSLSHCPSPPVTAEQALTTACRGHTLLCTDGLSGGPRDPGELALRRPKGKGTGVLAAGTNMLQV